MESGQKGSALWKKISIGLGIVVLLWAAFIYVGEHMDDIVRWKMDRDARAFDAIIASEKEKLRQMEMADTYGSTTPEETVELIILALEKGDIDLASKYYYVLDQEKAKASFEKQLAEKGNLDTAIIFYKDLLRGTKGCNEQGDGCTLEFEFIREKEETVLFPGANEPTVFPKGSAGIGGNDFELNVFNGIWKALKR
jgi:hypothetical protein